MSSIDSRGNYSYLNFLVSGLLIVGGIGLFISALIFLATGISSGIFSLELCFTNDCASRFLKYFSVSFLILGQTLNILVGFATIGGIIVALMSYLNSANATALTNHISHFSIFQSYLTSEISKRSRISPASVDTFLWYNSIFSNSRSGKTSIDPAYCQLISAVNAQITASNLQAQTAAQGSYRYMPHQQRIIQALNNFGIVLTHQPRNEYYEIEDQVFSLISSVNSSFCYSAEVPKLVSRKYV